MFGVCVCVCVCVCVYTISIYFYFKASNQEIYDFYKWIIFKKERLCGEKIFDISEFI